MKRPEETLDQDLDRALDYVWQKHPYPDKIYTDLLSKLLIVQELRNLNKNLAKLSDAKSEEKTEWAHVKATQKHTTS